MLKEIYIQNLAIIEAVRLNFGQGFHVLTGETGAGKSILVEAIGLILGQKVKANLLRVGENQGIVEAVFAIQDSPNVTRVLSELDLLHPDDPQELVIKRSLQADGKNKAFVNHQRVTLANLQRLAVHLVDFTGQHDQLQLLKSERSRDLLDAFLPSADVQHAYTKEFVRARDINTELQTKETAALEKEERLHWIEFQLKELKTLKIESEEELQELQGLSVKLKHKETIDEFWQKLSALEESQKNTLQNLIQLWEKKPVLQEMYPEFEKRVVEITQAMEDLSFDVAKTARSEIGDSDFQNVSDVQGELYKIERLLRKFGPTLPDVLQKNNELQQEKSMLEALDVDIINLKKKLAKQLVVLKEKAIDVFEARKTAAQKVAKAIQKELKSLLMDKAEFQIRVVLQDDLQDFASYTSHGADTVGFWLSANPGLGFQPLAEVASGGEMSRIFLAIKNVLSQSLPLKTFIFDEIDTGISGAAVELTGKKLKALAKTAQVFCVTHHAQIASLADHHYFVFKDVLKGKTLTKVKRLSDDDQVGEVARLMGGVKISQKNLEYAKEMLSEKAPKSS